LECPICERTGEERVMGWSARNKGRFGVPVFGVAFVLGSLLAVSSAGLAFAAAATKTVDITSSGFEPATVTVNVGDTVKWTNSDGTTHTATADDGSFDTGSMGAGAAAQVVFHSPGSFVYRCAFHPSLSGTVTVVGTKAATAAKTTTKTNTADRPPKTDTILGLGPDARIPGVIVVMVLTATALAGFLVAFRRATD